MKIIKPYARIISPWAFSGPGEQGIALAEEAADSESQRDVGLDALKFVEWCGRISHRSEDKQNVDSWKRFIETVVLGHGDWSIVEHVSVSVDAVVDRGITHEWVRHRLFSYTQESTRFVNYEKKMPPSFIYPQVDVECELCLNGDGTCEKYEGSGRWSFEHARGEPHYDYVECVYDRTWLEGIYYAEKQYRELLRIGWRPQEARSVFPNALASRIISTTNLRCWRHFLIMRTCAEAHPQMKQVTIPLLKEFQETFPILFDDVVPNQKQSEAIKKAQ